MALIEHLLKEGRCYFKAHLSVENVLLLSIILNYLDGYVRVGTLTSYLRLFFHEVSLMCSGVACTSTSYKFGLIVPAVTCNDLFWAGF